MKRSRAARCALVSAIWAATTVAAALAPTLLLRQLALRVYFILFVPAVMFSTWFGGHLAGLIAGVPTVAATVFLPRAEVVDQLASGTLLRT